MSFIKRAVGKIERVLDRSEPESKEAPSGGETTFSSNLETKVIRGKPNDKGR